MDDFAPECFEDDFAKIKMKELQNEIDVSGVSNIKEILHKRLERWREVEVNVAITGDEGSGKSSFINAIRELHEDDDGEKPVDVEECTKEPTAYDHPTNSNIKFWGLPGIGTPNYPDMETYIQKVQLEKYHTILIFTATRFTTNDLLLAEKIRSMKKSFFFIRTKIDVDVKACSRKRSFNEEATLMKVRRNCSKNLGDLLSNQEDIFLISNHEPDKWDFVRLTEAILDGLTRYQRENLTLSLGKAITRSSEEIFLRKVNILKGRIWKIAAVSAAAAIFPFSWVSVAIDNALISSELRLYRSQLGLPEEGSAEFAKLPLATKEKVKKVASTTAAQLIEFLEPYVVKALGKEVASYLPVVSMAIASGISYGVTYYALYKLLGAVEDAVLSVLREAHEMSSAELKVE